MDQEVSTFQSKKPTIHNEIFKKIRWFPFDPLCDEGF
jgi:hypothetical protein